MARKKTLTDSATQSADAAVAQPADAPASDAPRASDPALDATRDDVRAAMAARVQRVVEREMDAVERVLEMLGPAGQAEADRSARTLANVARTLREINALNAPETVTAADDTDDDALPRDIDRLRCELAERINALVRARRQRGGGGGDAGAAGVGTDKS